MDLKDKVRFSKVSNNFISSNSASNLVFKYGFVFYDNSISVKDNFLEKWHKINVGQYILHFHYEAKFRRININNTVVIVLGDIFVAHGDCTVEETISTFVLTNNWDVIDNLSGRFTIIIINSNNGGKVIIDPFGARTLFYKAGNKVAFSSHAQLLARILSKGKSSNSVKYMASNEYKSKATRFLPGDLTLFDDIFGLTPNNYLSLSDNSTVRFWPRKDIKKSQLDDLKLCCEEYFRNFCKYLLAEGNKPIFGLTGGVDTRAVISAFKKNDFNFKTITWDYPSVNEDEREVIAELSEYLGVDNIWVDTNYKENDATFELLRDAASLNSGGTRGRALLPAQTIPYIESNEVFIRGLGGEILRGSYNRNLSPNRKSLTDLEYFISVYNGYKLNSKNTSEFYKSFTENAFLGFMERANYHSIYNVDSGDLVYWEQRMAMWAANLNNEYDVALKNLVGINSRKLYEISYGLESNIRFRRELLLDITSFFDKGLSKIKLV